MKAAHNKMVDITKYNKAFINSFSIEEKQLEGLEYNKIEAWDSIGHMSLMSDLEELFKITFETDDIIDFSSYKKGIEILKKYKIKL